MRKERVGKYHNRGFIWSTFWTLAGECILKVGVGFDAYVMPGGGERLSGALPKGYRVSTPYILSF